jgi:signal transduction histidine kinase/ligand-binding sensor domain-containing protein
MRPRAVLACLLVAAGPRASAQALDPGKALTQYHVDTWTTADNLPQNSVTAILQSRDGYLWLGTYGGLGRFDGVRFATFDTANTPELLSNGIQALLEDRVGAVWIATNGGGLTRCQGGRFTTTTAAEGLPSDIVRCLKAGRDGSLWIGTNDGLSRFQGGRFTNLTTKEGLTNGVVRALEEDETGLWIGTNGGGLDRLEGDTLTHLTDRDGLPSNFVFALLRTRDGSLWIGTNGGGLARRDQGKIRTFTTRDGLPSNIIWSLHEDAGGTLWVGTYGGGIARFRNGRFEALGSRDGLSNDFVRALASDREGSLWIGTYAGGLCRLRDGKFTTYTTREGLGHDFARTVLEDRDGALWVGTTGGGLCRLRADRFRCWSAADGLAEGIRALHQDPAGNLWVGTDGAGLFRFEGGRFRRVETGGGLSHANVGAISDDGQGGLWIGTNGGGLVHFAGGRFTDHRAAEGRAGNFILATLVDRRGVVWAGTDGAGLARLEDGRFTTVRRKDGLAGDIVFCLYEDAAGALWVGTSGGLSRYQEGRFTSFTTRQGLVDDVVFQILEDGEGRFWLSGNKGISRVAKADLEALARGERASISPVRYGTADGMKSNECSGVAQPAGARGKDGRLWFPTTRGVVVIDPAHIAVNPLVPPVEIEEVVVDGEPAASLDFPPGRARWEFHYTAPSFLAPGRVQFKYRLEGFDPDWVPADTRRTAYYTRLPPGRYTFHVIASNPDGVWNEAGAKVELSVRPFFWETRWFYALCALGAGLGGFRTFRLRVRQLREHKRELEALVAVRTRDLLAEKERSEAARAEAERQNELAQEADRQKGELLSIAAHDLKTPLQTIIGYAEMMAERPGLPEASEFAERTAQAARRMVEIINRLLEGEAIARGGMPLSRGIVDVGRLAQAMVLSLEPQAGTKKQRIHAAVEPSCLVNGDEDWLRQVLENLIGNAIKYSPERRSIWLSVRRNGGTVVIEVRDEGPGLTEDDKAKLFGRFQRLSARPTGGEIATGLGLSIVKQLVDLHEGRVWAESAGPDQGTRFYVELPSRDG